MAASVEHRLAVPAARRHGPLRRVSMALPHLVATAGLLVAIVVAGIAISIGMADAQVLTAGAVHDPDTGLVLALMLLAIAVMGILSAAAVRFSSRPRGR